MARVFVYGKQTTPTTEAKSTRKSSAAKPPRKNKSDQDRSVNPASNDKTQGPIQSHLSGIVPINQIHTQLKENPLSYDPFIALSILLNLAIANQDPSFNSDSTKVVHAEKSPAVFIENAQFKSQLEQSTTNSLYDSLDENSVNQSFDIQRKQRNYSITNLKPEELDFEIDSNLDISEFDLSDDSQPVPEDTLSLSIRAEEPMKFVSVNDMLLNKREQEEKRINSDDCFLRKKVKKY